MTGHGWGHGIGMGQWGALGYAINEDDGQGNCTYQQIVAHYYGPATLGNLSEPLAVLGAERGRPAGTGCRRRTAGSSAFGGARSTARWAASRSTSRSSGMAATPTAGATGWWPPDGGIFSFGDAHFHGSMGGQPLNEPVVGMAATRHGGGYWEVASDGGIFSFGTPPSTARWAASRSTADRRHGGDADGGGYWLVAADGGIFGFGNADVPRLDGRQPSIEPVVGMAADPGRRRVLAGGVGRRDLHLRNATFHGSAAGTAGGNGVVGMAATPSGGGYLVTTTAGRVTASATPRSSAT